MGEPIQDRRAAKKAQTRIEVRQVAHRLFAQHGFDDVTVADIAAEAEVAVQTVFNHFPTKEELYYAGRAPWVDGPARAVAARRPGTGAVTTAEGWIAHHVLGLPRLLRRPAARRYLDVILASPSLLVHQRELFRRTEDRLAQAFVDTWTEQLGEVPGLRLPAELVAGVLVSTARVTLNEQWRTLGGTDPRAVEHLETLTRFALKGAMRGISQVAEHADGPDVLVRVARLEHDLPADLDAARRTAAGRPVQAAGASTTGSRTVSTSSATPSSVMGTAKTV